jgi:hypothetical protein
MLVSSGDFRLLSAILSLSVWTMKYDVTNFIPGSMDEVALESFDAILNVLLSATGQALKSVRKKSVARNWNLVNPSGRR